MSKKYKKKGMHNTWRSYSDMMAGLLLLFILIMSVALISFQKSYESEVQARKKQEKLSDELEKQKKIMEEQQKKIDNIVGIKAELIEDLTQEFKAKKLKVSIDEDTGAIIFDANVMFDYNKSTLTKEGKKMLDQLLPVYCKALLKKKYRPYLSQIIIDGYTDNKGSVGYNLQLSQKRSMAVVNYLLSIEKKFLDKKEQGLLESKISVNGRGKNDLVHTNKGKVDANASRRVEVKFRLTDEEMIKELQKILKDNKK